ncbi:hypothetical protein FIBSPDRAFT_932442 [Athelia psychrophila]|uniref:Uncharacterized protein n=1 Tax=Athelia psychrophila TaxID=1759441 RepID=A0A166IUP4_9AGAM|nr:hypothetical protein FIBSPDRAFT_932442 [Fibularhizoctonia sp. CBS 109695]
MSITFITAILALDIGGRLSKVSHRFRLSSSRGEPAATQNKSSRKAKHASLYCDTSDGAPLRRCPSQSVDRPAFDEALFTMVQDPEPTNTKYTDMTIENILGFSPMSPIMELAESELCSPPNIVIIPATPNIDQSNPYLNDHVHEADENGKSHIVMLIDMKQLSAYWESQASNL